MVYITWLPGLLTSLGLVGSLSSDSPSTRSFGIDMPGRLRSPPPPSVSEPRSDALVASSARMRSRSDFLCSRTPPPPPSPAKKNSAPRLSAISVHSVCFVASHMGCIHVTPQPVCRNPSNSGGSVAPPGTDRQRSTLDSAARLRRRVGGTWGSYGTYPRIRGGAELVVLVILLRVRGVLPFERLHVARRVRIRQPDRAAYTLQHGALERAQAPLG